MALSDTEIREKVAGVLRDMNVRTHDELGRTIPEGQWAEVPAVLRSLGEDDLADEWEEAEE